MRSIDAQRRTMDLTIEQLASAASMSERTYRRLLAGDTREPQRRTMVKLKKAMKRFQAERIREK